MPNGVELKQIKKRDGRVVEFDQSKIAVAIFNAFKAHEEAKSGGPLSEEREKALRGEARRVSDEVVSVLEITFKYRGGMPSVEEIQDLVEDKLMALGYHEVAKRYILYRQQRAQLREIRKVFSDALGLVEKYLGRADWRVRENSNMSFSLQGLNNYISSAVASQYWLQKIYPPEIANLHLEGDFHIHDLGILGAYCCGWDLYTLLLNGFGGVYGKVESAPPRHLKSALGQIVNFFYTLQGETAGAQAFSNFDTLLAPFVAYDRLEYPDVKQAMQEFIFNLNVPTRVGFQTPFTNLTMDLVPPSYHRDEAVLIGGKAWDNHTYGEFQKEMDWINRAFCEVMMEGDAKGRIFTFPIPTYNITKDFDWSNSNLRPLWEMVARYGIPYFANYINSDMSPEDARSMCCRLRLDNRPLRDRDAMKGGGLFGAYPLTGSIGVVTLNMNRAAHLADGSKERFFERIGFTMEMAKRSLETKRKVLEELTDVGLYPYSRCYLASVKERHDRYWSNHFSTIGLIGMNEACVTLLGESIASSEGRELAIEVLKFMRDKLRTFHEETGNFYNLEATPGEGAAYRLAKVDKKRFPDIFTMGKEHPYYTNSTQLPVDYTDDLFVALEHQDKLQSLYTGGTVLHFYVGERIDDPNMVKRLTRRIAEKYSLPYFTLTPTFTICPVHGYIPGEHHECPYEVSDEQEMVQ